MTDRGRETSSELAEIRTVVNRANTALEFLRGLKYQKTIWARVQDDRGLWHRADVDRTPDPDLDEMISFLEDVVTRGEKWRKTGKITKNINYPEGVKG